MMNLEIEHVHARAERSPQRPANVLIVDDDVDSAVQVGTVFNHLGCQTTVTPGWVEAKKRIVSLKADLIVLDWILDRDIDGGMIVRECARMLSKVRSATNGHEWRKPRIITYSSLPERAIHIPSNPFFEHIAHWKKPLTQRSLLTEALTLLDKIAAGERK
jgi:CheY-like chemotaxis protein